MTPHRILALVALILAIVAIVPGPWAVLPWLAIAVLLLCIMQFV